MAPLNYFLGIVVTRDLHDGFLSQQKYTIDILERANMLNYKFSCTPPDKSNSFDSYGPSLVDPTRNRSLVEALQYLTFTRPDIPYAI